MGLKLRGRRFRGGELGNRDGDESIVNGMGLIRRGSSSSVPIPANDPRFEAGAKRRKNAAGVASSSTSLSFIATSVSNGDRPPPRRMELAFTSVRT